jgi:hypothetical protein
MQPRYPIYIPTKGRWQLRHTIRRFEQLNIHYRAVIEAPEYDQYRAVVSDETRLLVLPTVNQGLVAARNWIWDHAQGEGHARHWQIDDNIREWYRFHKNQRVRIDPGVGLRMIEDFVDRYTNVALAGPHYKSMVVDRQRRDPFLLNHRVYSCSLIKTDIPYRYRSFYNDDTDLSLRVLKDGWCTVLFMTFLQHKMQTMVVKGGNTPVYQDDGRLQMAQQLVDQHPDVVRLGWRWGRPQHVVDYRLFERNKLILKPDAVIPTEDQYRLFLAER